MRFFSPNPPCRQDHTQLMCQKRQEVFGHMSIGSLRSLGHCNALGHMSQKQAYQMWLVQSKREAAAGRQDTGPSSSQSWKINSAKIVLVTGFLYRDMHNIKMSKVPSMKLFREVSKLLHTHLMASHKLPNFDLHHRTFLMDLCLFQNFILRLFLWH